MSTVTAGAAGQPPVLDPVFPAAAGQPIEAVAAFPGLALNGVGVSPEGRIFISLPRWGDGATPGVAELLADGTYRPFPGGAWNAWEPGASPSEGLVSVHSIYADRDNFLWIADEGPPSVARTLGDDPSILPKVVQVDLRTNKVVRVYPIGDAAPVGSSLGHLRTDSRYIYISEPVFGAVIIIERTSGKVRRRLAGASIGQAHPNIIPVIAGVPLLAAGRPVMVHLDLLELDKAGRKLFFMPLFGPTLYSLKIKDLTNWALSDAELERRAKVEAAVPPATGLTKSPDGTLYLCSITDMAIMRLGPNKKWEVVARDPRIYLPNEPSFAPDGSFYFPVSRLGPIPDLGIISPPMVYRLQPARPSTAGGGEVRALPPT